MVYKALLLNRRFLNITENDTNSTLKTYWSFQGVNKRGRWNSWTPNSKTDRQLDFWLSQSSRDVKLFFNENKKKVTKCLKCVKEFLHRFDLANEKYFSIFLRVFCKNRQSYTFCSGYQFFGKGPQESSSLQGK